ncbi:tetratricopeptide repeat protein [Streptomyces sp. NPDC051576]|uniref:tetratricopeptide repeat protein n=1 Tax=Streptomyces sp. NPDC051576 TaxID=3155803 RepID=UPI00342925C0
MTTGYGGDHLDFGRAEFSGPFTAKAEYHQHGAAPTALDALPARAAGFTGRGDELAQLLDAFDPSVADAPEAVVVAAVSGLGGIGKTALAVEAAHTACEKGWFPGGVLFVNLHGYDDDLVAAEQAVEALLRALGVEPEHIPTGVDARAALYRSALVERGRERGAVLVLADNASSAEQVRPLLPGGTRHRLLVTSRSKLPQLGARLMSLDELSEEEAYELLDRALRIADPSDGRVTDEVELAAELAFCCGYLPLALQIAAALLVMDRGKSVAELVSELTEFGHRLEHLDDGERSVRAAFDLSYKRLPPEQARMLRLLALAPGPDVSEEVAAALIGTDTPPVRVLEALFRTHLVDRGTERERRRWRLHDLVRAFALAVDSGPEDEGELARERVLDLYLRRAHAADARLRWLQGMPEPPWFADSAQALAWLDGERAGLVVAVGWAEEKRYASSAVLLAACLTVYLQRQRHLDDWLTACRSAQLAAHGLGDRDREAGALSNLGNALRSVGKTAEAIEAHTRARDFFREVGEVRHEAVALNNLGLDLAAACRQAEAIEVYTRARHLFHAVDDLHAEAVTWECLGNALSQTERVADAVEALTRARDLFKAVADPRREAGAWNNLGVALLVVGRLGEATESFETARGIFQELGDWYWTGQVLYNSALSVEAHDPAGAAGLWLQASDAYRRADAAAEAAESRALAEEQQRSLPGSSTP